MARNLLPAVLRPRARRSGNGEQSGTGQSQRGERFWMLGDPRQAGLLLKLVSSAAPAACLGPVPPPGGPAGVKRRRAGAELRPHSPHLALRRPWPRRWMLRGLAERGRGENVTSAGSGGRRGEATRTCPCPSRRPRPLGRAHRRPPPALRAPRAPRT